MAGEIVMPARNAGKTFAMSTRFKEVPLKATGVPSMEGWTMAVDEYVEITQEQWNHLVTGGKPARDDGVRQWRDAVAAEGW